MAYAFPELTANTSDAKVSIGTARNVAGCSYVYVQLFLTAAGAAANGTVLYGTLADPNVVTDAISTTKVNLARGVAIGTITLGYYGWIQTWGPHSAVKTDGGDDIATGDALIGDTTTNGVCDSVAQTTAPTHKVIGWATSVDNDTNDTVAAYLVLEKSV